VTFAFPAGPAMCSGRALGVLAVVCAALACGEDAVEPPRAAAVTVVAGHDVTTTVGTLVTAAVRVEDAGGQGVGNVSVGWAVTSGNGSVNSATTTTNSAGEAVTGWTLGTTPGPNTLIATVAGLAPVTLAAAATVGAPASLMVVSGDQQSADPGEELPLPVVVRVGDAYDNGVPGVPVHLSSLSGSFVPPIAMTNESGEVSARWVLGLSEGPHSAVASLQGPAQGIWVGVTATAVLSPITPLSGQLAVGTHHVCLIQADGTTACWGDDGVAGGGALGRGVRLPPVSARVQVAVDPGFASIHSRGQYTCARSTAGEAYCWGINTNGQALGDGTRYPFSPNPLVPTPLSHGPYARVSPARLTTCALGAGGAAVCWGLNQRGEVGDGTTTLRLTPVPVSTSLRFASIEASWIHTCALTAEGAAHCWGNWRGQVDGTFDLTPVELPGGHTFVSLHSGSTHTCGIDLTAATWCWGDNASGQLGDGTISGGGIPVRVATQQRFVAVATGTAANFGGRNHTCAVANTGVVSCWGLNDRGQLGDGTTVGRLVPTPVLSDERFVAVGAGDFFSCAMTSDRRVFCWGDNTLSQLGSGVGGISPIPVLVP
jgi:alpha-tubulin suppressor-like RCC1 family protein